MKDKALIIVILSLVAIYSPTQAQMFINGDTLYGNEWINYNQNYAKISVLQDGVHSLSYENLQSAGVFAGGTTPNGSNFQVFYMGQEIPLFVNNNGVFGPGDYIEFKGGKNKGELDKHLYIEPEYHLNPKNSIFTDTAAYFLTWNTSASNSRFTEIAYDPTNLPPAESYCFKTIESAFFNQWQKGKQHGGSSARYSDYDIAEGFTATKVVSKTINVTTPGMYTSGQNTQITTRFLSESGAHDINIKVEGTTQITDSYSDWAVKEYSFEVPSSSLGNSTQVIIAGTNSSSDKVGVSFVEIKYPKAFDFNNNATFEFELPGNSGNKKYLEITGFNHGGVAPVLYDLTNELRIETQLSSNTVLVVLPPSNVERTLVLVSTSDYKNAIRIEPRNFIDFTALGGDYIVISNERLFDDGSGTNYVQEYVDYRASAAGGSFNAVLAEVQQIYDQYSYGINRHEMSVKNFTESQISFGNLEYLFLIGDALRFANMHNTWNTSYFVPTYGHPTTDHIFATDKGEFVPKIPIGRLPAQTAGHVSLYLDKVMEYEQNLMRPQSIDDKAWMKHVVHLGGGDPGIQNLIKGELNQMKDIIDNSTFGAKTFSFFKTSSDVIQEVPSEQIKSLIDNGVSLLTFFGHSAPSVLDFDLENPAAYSNNNGKYPIVYAIGCHTCRTSEYDGTISERWILIENKGAVAFLGATWETTLSNLSSYAKFFYQNYGTNNYGERLGDICLATINDFDLSSSFFAQQLKQVNVLIGDPALKLNHHEGPDYLVNEASVNINPSIVSSQMDSFTINLASANIGSSVSDSISLQIEQELPNGTVIPSKTITTISPRYQNEYSITLPIPKEDILGFNKLIITVDANDSIPEAPDPVAEMNNAYKFPFYVVANDAFPVYPYEYSIVTKSNITLKASTANAFASAEKYYFQIDTTAYFDSPLRQETTITQEGGVISWTPAIPYIDNEVYYWRVSIDSTQTSGLGFNWHESSFVYMENSSLGWNQSHFHQLTKENEYENITLEEPGRKMEYRAKLNELIVKNGPAPFALPSEMTPVLNGGLLSQYWLGNGNGVHVTVLDDETLTPWNNPPGGDHGSHQNVSWQDINAFPFYTNNLANRELLINFLENIIPDNAYVVVFTIQTTAASYFPEDWALDSLNNSFGKNIFQVLEEQGATKVRQLETTGSLPYFFVYQKNNPDFLVTHNYNTEVLADSLLTIIEGTYIIESPLSEGSVKSTVIGPASEWGSLAWGMEDYNPAFDEASLNVYGINQANSEVLIHPNISVYDTTLNHINPQTFPRLRLEFTSKDSLFRTSPNLDFWRVLYQPVPDAALRPDIYVSFKDSVQQGEHLILDIAVENISDTDMDSLLVHYTIIDQNNNNYLTGTRMAPLLTGDTLNAYLSFDTRDITTPINQLLIEVNPNNDQLEQHHFNNIGLHPFYVALDKRNPLLDVTFDGVHIMDGDIISAKPLINIILKDENENLALNDTSLFRIRLLYPEETVPREFHLSDDGLTFYPADEANLDKENKARIEIRKLFEQDGIYELSIRAVDQTGNNSGEFDYKTRFEVINEAMVSNVLNYPNPFSTSTQFVFTLTGSEVPDFMKIQIMTVSGKIIREITQDELGPIHVGKNMTEYRWDGTDEFGDRLANGVYLYRVVTRETNGSEYKKYNTGTNEFFKNGFGKMVIMR